MKSQPAMNKTVSAAWKACHFYQIKAFINSFIVNEDMAPWKAEKHTKIKGEKYWALEHNHLKHCLETDPTGDSSFHEQIQRQPQLLNKAEGVSSGIPGPLKSKWTLIH